MLKTPFFNPLGATQDAGLTHPVWSTARKVGMFTLRAYLVIAVILLVVKTIQLATGH